MAVFRVEKTRDYTVMANHHLRNTELSLKAKGLLSLMLSLPEEWDYTTKGLARICKDGVDSICAGVRELEDHGYVVRERIRNPNGQLGAIEYTILEQPRTSEPKRENPVQANPALDLFASRKNSLPLATASNLIFAHKKTNWRFIMIEINLREFYPECYKSDYFVEVPDEVDELLILLRRHEQSQRRRIYKNKAHYSLDIYENVERETMLKSPSAEEVFEQLAEQEQLYDAMMALTHKQRTRLYAYFFLNMSYSKIAEQEGVDVSTVRKSVQQALRKLQSQMDLF